MSNLTDNSMGHLLYLPRQYLTHCQSQQQRKLRHILSHSCLNNNWWISILDDPLLDSMSDYSKCNILILLYLYLLQGENSYPMIPYHYPHRKVRFEEKTPSSNTKNTITMVETFNATAAWLWQFIQYPWGSIFGTGWLRAGCKGFIQLCKSAEIFFFNKLIDL